MINEPSTNTILSGLRIAVIDPDEMIRGLFKYNLEDAGFNVDVYPDADSALAEIENVDLTISEVVLGDINGLMLAGLLKSKPSTAGIPIILCSTRDTEDDIIRGLDAGADDYMVKPVSLREMVARTRSVIRRHNMRPYRMASKIEMPQTAQGEAEVFKTMHLSDSDRVGFIDGKRIPLTRTEFSLLYFLMKNRNKFFSPAELYRAVWQKDETGPSRALDVSISRLRKKIGPYAGNLANRSGVGYGFIEN